MIPSQLPQPRFGKLKLDETVKSALGEARWQEFEAAGRKFQTGIDILDKYGIDIDIKADKGQYWGLSVHANVHEVWDSDLYHEAHKQDAEAAKLIHQVLKTIVNRLNGRINRLQSELPIFGLLSEQEIKAPLERLAQIRSDLAQVFAKKR